MTDRISIHFALAEGAVLRIIGLMERRGYQVRAIGMSERDDGETASMVVEIAPRDADRRLEVLDRQLRRLVDVRSVSGLPMPLASAA